MLRTVEAIVDESGTVHLREGLQLSVPHRALVTILEEAPPVHEAAILSEAALSDWNRAEEEEAWSHLQPGR